MPLWWPNIKTTLRPSRPHPTSMSPGPASSALVPRDFIAERLGHLPPDVLRKVLHENAARIYHLD